MKKEMKIIRVQCLDCRKTIFSKYSGHFSVCDCADDDCVYIDQTEYYCRIGGRADKYVILPDE